ncbi:MAG: Clp1/GlmU family protein [Thermodesulfobacteriota bacterium]
MPESFSFLKNLDIPPAWEEAARRFLEEGGLALVLGAAGTGKSTLCQYLIYRAYVAGEPVALVDLDLGQSHLGPPGALGLGLFPPRFPGDYGLFPEGLYFVGQTSPVGVILEVSVGCRRLVDEARTRGVNRVVVNTSGLVSGPAAWRLKQAQVELLHPTLLLALAQERELAPLLASLSHGSRTLELPVSPRAVLRGPEDRRQYRETRFRRYFDRARRVDLPLSQIAWHGPPLGWGKPLAPKELDRWSSRLGEQVLYGAARDSQTVLLLDLAGPDTPCPEAPEQVHLLKREALDHHLVGLWDSSHRTLALGILLPSDWQEGQVRVWTPLPAAQESAVSSLSLGRLKLSLSGRELASGT